MSPGILLGLVLAQAASLPVLTLDDALHEAREHNPDVKVAEARLAQAKTVARKAWSNYLPQVALGGSYTYNNVEAKIGMPTGYAVRKLCTTPEELAAGCTNPDLSKAPSAEELAKLPGVGVPLFMVPVGFREAVIQKQHQLGAQLSVSQTILAPALWPALQQAYLAEEYTALSVDSARREILFAIAQLYFGAAGAREAVAVQRKQLEANLAHEADAQRKVDVGVATKIVLLRAQIDRTKSEADLKRAENAYASARSALAALLDREPAFEVTPPEELPLPDDLDALVAGVDRRPDLLAAETGVTLAQKGQTSTQLSYLPNLGVQAAVREANVAGFAGQTRTWFATLGLNWTLWDGGLREATLEEGAARQVEAEATLKSARLKAADEVRRARLDLDSARANRLKAEETVKLAREGRDLVEVGFKVGTSTYVEVADANTALVGAELGRIAETLNARLAVLKLAKAAGAFDPK